MGDASATTTIAAATITTSTTAQIASLDVHEVRWFFCEEDSSIAAAAAAAAAASATAAAPTTPPKWQPFCSHDSQTLEEAYRKTLPTWTTDPNSVTTEEPHAQSTEDLLVPVRGGLYDVNIQKRTATSPFWKGPPQRVQRAMWFMADVPSQATFCDPCDESVCTQVEAAHVSAAWALSQRRKVEGEDPALSAAVLSTSPPTATKVKATKSQFLHQITLSGSKQFVIWYDVNTVHLCTESTIGNISQHFTSRKQGYRIIRGYSAARAGIVDSTGRMGEQYCRCGEVRHLVMAAHGIGQKISQTVAARAHTAIHEQTRRMRVLAEELAAEGVAGEDLKKGKSRVEFLPIEWRTSLPLDEYTVGSITPKGADFLRRALNHTIVDVLYFTSPKYCQDIVDSMTNALNKQYKEFVKRHPYFEEKGGKVSIIAHSLGGVITMEILSNQDSKAGDAQHREERQLQMLREEVARLERKLAQKQGADTDVGNTMPTQHSNPHDHMHRADSSTTIKPNGVLCDKLLFKVDTLFAIGSPVSLFLSLRGASAHSGNPLHGKHLLPKGVRVYNVYHALDPVAYRLEPLLLDDETQPPLPIPKYVSDKAKGLTFSSVTKAASQAASGLITSIRKSSFLTPSKKKVQVKQPKFVMMSASEDEPEDEEVEDVLKEVGGAEALLAGGTGGEDGDEEEDPAIKGPAPVFESPEKTRLADGDRVDFIIGGRYLESSTVYQYAQVPRAHLRYWTDKDFIMFTLQRLTLQ